MEKKTNQEIIDKYLNRFEHSKQSMSTRKSCLNYFFKKFGYSGLVLNITKSDLIDYFDFLNQLKTISLGTKKTKWTLLKSFLEYCMEYYDDFLVKIPKHSINWQPNHMVARSNKDVVMDLDELKKIFDFLKIHHFIYYMIFRIFSETGMRKGELISIDYDQVNLEKRYIETIGKRGRKIYYISNELNELLKIYINERKIYKKVESKALFLSRRATRFNIRIFNLYLRKILKEIGIDKNITCHTFRKTLNTLRKNMGCPNEDRKILINHKTRDINVESYVKLKYVEFIELYDKWYPYSTISI